jgi:periplasmic copper chaperone A
MKTRLLILTLFFSLLAACAPTKPVVSSNGIEIYAPMVTAAKTGAVAGAFMTIKNDASETDRLVGATCEAAMMTQVHETVMKGDVMNMNEVADIEVPAGQMLELKHGSYHIMLMDLKQDLKAGDTITVTLKFEKAGEVAVPMTVTNP